MENASKALIIAGAILLAILIIGLGVFIYNQASNSIGNTGMDQLAIQQFNRQFELYEGTQPGNQVKQLLKAVISNNYTHSDDTSLQVKVNGIEIPTENYNLNSIGDGKTYSITFDRNNKNGIIYNINLTEI